MRPRSHSPNNPNHSRASNKRREYRRLCPSQKQKARLANKRLRQKQGPCPRQAGQTKTWQLSHLSSRQSKGSPPRQQDRASSAKNSHQGGLSEVTKQASGANLRRARAATRVDLTRRPQSTQKWTLRFCASVRKTSKSKRPLPASALISAKTSRLAFLRSFCLLG